MNVILSFNSISISEYYVEAGLYAASGMGNLMLAAHSLGLGSIWIHRAKQEFESDEGKEILKQLGIEDEWEGIGHCAVGYMDCELPPPPARKDGRVVWA